MNFKKIKKLFYALFVFDIIAATAICCFIDILYGIVVGAVLLILNITSYSVILKIQKIREHNDGYAKERENI